VGARQREEAALEADDVAVSREVGEGVAGGGLSGARNAEPREDGAAPEGAAFLGAQQIEDTFFQFDDASPVVI